MENYVINQFKNHLFDQAWAQTIMMISYILFIAFLTRIFLAPIICYITRKLLIKSGYKDWDLALYKRSVYRNFYRTLPFIMVHLNLDIISTNYIGEAISRMAEACAWLFACLVTRSILSAWQDTYSASTKAQTKSIKGYIQISKLIVLIACIVIVISILMNRSPLWLISALSAVSAVLLFIFRDTLLSFVASTQLASNEMLRIGDWIEMPQANVNGFVKDMTLHTVKIQNWDNTVTSVPTYKLFSESYRNHRHMFESGGRRIKRTLKVDSSTIKFITEKDFQHLVKFKLLRQYLQNKQAVLLNPTIILNEHDNILFNKRKLTNISIFREYIFSYLKEHSEIRNDMTIMVRMMEPESIGIPVEVYCFTTLTAWFEYEKIQGDIFDHLIGMLPEFGLRLYQAPSALNLDIGRTG